MSIASFYNTVVAGVKSELMEASYATSLAAANVKGAAYAVGSVKTVEEAHALAASLAEHAATIAKASEHTNHVANVLGGVAKENVT